MAVRGKAYTFPHTVLQCVHHHSHNAYTKRPPSLTQCALCSALSTHFAGCSCITTWWQPFQLLDYHIIGEEGVSGEIGHTMHGGTAHPQPCQPTLLVALASQSGASWRERAKARLEKARTTTVVAKFYFSLLCIRHLVTMMRKVELVSSSLPS